MNSSAFIGVGLASVGWVSPRSSLDSGLPPARKGGFFISRRRVTTVKSADTGTVPSAQRDMQARTNALSSRAAAGAPLLPSERNDVIASVQKLMPDDSSVDFEAFDHFLAECGHIPHKNWDLTGRNAETFAAILLPDGISPASRSLLVRVLSEGNWDGAETNALARGTDTRGERSSWAVLVSGVNGIRKTTSVYQKWFPQLLAEALVPPARCELGAPPLSELPHGTNAFFRQLDHMVATLVNSDFEDLYAWTGLQMAPASTPSPSLITQYSDLKAAIFARYRTLSELLGVTLVREATSRGMNWMCETSGKDVAMFHYIDQFTPPSCRKLVLRFTINDLRFAQTSVDSRMVREIHNGLAAVASGDVLSVVNANAGGPYGSEVLPVVEEASNRVWEEVVNGQTSVGDDWYKATIAITANSTTPWTARAVLPGGSLGKEHFFELRT